LTVKEGVQNTLVTYELIGLIVFKGSFLDVGHYYAYVLNSDKKWYKLDDALDYEVPATAYETCNQNLSYIFFDRRCKDNRIDNELIDIIRDSYGKDKKNLQQLH